MFRRVTVALSIALAIGCGRIGFDATDPDENAAAVDGGDVARESNLLELLPGRTGELVGYWPMEGTWNDSGPLGNHLEQATGAPGFSTTAPVVGDQTGEFYDDALLLTNRPSVEIEELSFSVWFASDLVSTPNSNSGHTLFKLSCATCGGDPDIDITFYISARNDGGVNSSIGELPANALEAETWHHIAGVYATGEARLYLDGELVITDPSSRPPLDTSGSYLWVGQLWPNRSPLWNPQHLHGTMEELALWNAPLDDAEIRAIYANQHPAQ